MLIQSCLLSLIITSLKTATLVEQLFLPQPVRLIVYMQVRFTRITGAASTRVVGSTGFLSTGTKLSAVCVSPCSAMPTSPPELVDYNQPVLFELWLSDNLTSSAAPLLRPVPLLQIALHPQLYLTVSTNPPTSVTHLSYTLYRVPYTFGSMVTPQLPSAPSPTPWAA